MSIVSDDPNSFTHPPAAGSRRVSVLVALPVILGCAVVGSIAGVVHPLRSTFSSEHRSEGPPAELTLASVKLLESSPAAVQQRPSTDLPALQGQPDSVAAANVLSQSQSPAPTAVGSVRTGSVDRSPAPGASDSASLMEPERADARLEAPARLTGHNHRIARAKRQRRMAWRRARTSKPQTSGLEVLFSPIFPKK